MTPYAHETGKPASQQNTMNRFPFVRLTEGGSISSRKSESSHLQDSAMANNSGNQDVINYGASDHLTDANAESDSAASGSAFPPVITAGSRYRGHKEVDINKWDEEASQHLLTMRRPPGDLCDCLSPWRRLFRLRYPPPPQKMATNVENGFPLPFGVVWFVRDCAGCVCMVFTWLLIAYGEFVVACIILPQLPSAIIAWTFGFIYHIFALLAVASHLKAVFTDPGTVRLGNATRDAVMRIYLASGSNTPLVRCPKCLCIKPDRAHHCSCCRRCVRKMDHHCPWVNNCVGEGNQKFFVLFNLYIFLQSLAGLALIISFFLSCFSEFGKCEYPGSYSATASLINNIFFVSEATFFGLFTSVMSCSQVSSIISDETAVLFGLFTVAIGGTQLCAICKDETAVESLKRNKGTPRPRISKRETLANVFGRPFSWRWFSPFHPPAPLTPVVPPPPQESETSEGVSDLEMQSAQQHQHRRREDHYDDVYLV
ncbi:Palmitoyltransferase ZDHHC3 [Taenia solium]|eukprot:TsM_000499800 transcript=TsM_000499800 gene=TsM_000499800